MRRALLLAGLLAGAQGAESAPSVRASWEDAGRLLKVEVSGARPGAVVQVQVLRDRGPKGQALLHLRQMRLAADGDGKAQGVLQGGTGGPALYRVRARQEGGSPGEAVLGWKLGTPAHLEAVLAEEAFLARAFQAASTVIAEVERFQAAVSSDRAKGLEAWTAWREKDLEAIRAFQAEAFGRGGGFFPESHEKLCRTGLGAILQVELALYQGARTGTIRAWVGAGSGRTSLSEKDLDSHRELFRKESLWHRLSVMDALFQGATEDLGKNRPLRKDWTEMLERWDEAFKEAEALSSLGKAARAWLAAEEAGSPEAPALKASLVEAFRALQKEAGG